MPTHELSDHLINGRYLLLRKVGAGGMATVYEAVDRELDKRVAVKVLNPEHRSDEEQVGRFRQEARTTARVRHVHLVDVTDRGISAEGIPFLVMEFLEGKSLHQELTDSAGPLPWRRVVGIIVQVCAALEAAHQQGLVHRDVKPGNCFLVRRPGQDGDFVKVLDLGIAKIVRGPRDPDAPPSTRTGAGGPGTPEFMSPEQVTGEATDARSDLYALGVMMFRMLTGKLPFTGKWWKVLEMHINLPPPGLRVMVPGAGIPASIEAIVLRCLAKRREDRWGGAAELAAALRAAELAETPPERSRDGADTEIRTILYHAPEPTRSFPRALYRGVAALQSFMLFSLTSMSLLLVDLPGVRTIGDWLLAGPVEPPRPPRPPPPAEPATSMLVPAAQPAGTAPTPAAPVSGESSGAGPGPAPTPPPALDSPPGGSESGSVEDPPTGPATAGAGGGTKDGAKDRPKPVPDPFDGGTGEVKEAPKTTKPVEPAALVRSFVRRKKGRLVKECGDMVPEGVALALELELENGTGRVREATVRPSRGPMADRCIRGVLVGLAIGDIKQGGKFPAEVQL